jgi:anaerobic selenocysteine-containing dehydrogenase
VPTLQEIVGLQAGHRWSSWVEVSPLAARGLGLRDGDWAWVESEAGRVRAQVRVFAGLWPDAVFMPAGMGHHTLVRWGRGSDTAVVVGSNAAQLAAAGIEALGGQAAGRLTRVRVVKA